MRSYVLAAVAAVANADYIGQAWGSQSNCNDAGSLSSLLAFAGCVQVNGPTATTTDATVLYSQGICINSTSYQAYYYLLADCSDSPIAGPVVNIPGAGECVLDSTGPAPVGPAAYSSATCQVSPPLTLATFEPPSSGVLLAINFPSSSCGGTAISGAQAYGLGCSNAATGSTNAWCNSTWMTLTSYTAPGCTGTTIRSISLPVGTCLPNLLDDGLGSFETSKVMCYAASASMSQTPSVSLTATATATAGTSASTSNTAGISPSSTVSLTSTATASKSKKASNSPYAVPTGATKTASPTKTFPAGVSRSASRTASLTRGASPSTTNTAASTKRSTSGAAAGSVAASSALAAALIATAVAAFVMTF